MNLKFNHFENRQTEKVFKNLFHGTDHVRVNENTVIVLWKFHNTNFGRSLTSSLVFTELRVTYSTFEVPRYTIILFLLLKPNPVIVPDEIHESCPG